MFRDRSIGSFLFDLVNNAFLVILALVCFLPLVHIIAVSLSDRPSSIANIIRFWPINFNTINYDRVLRDQQFIRSLWISVSRVLIGSVLNMLIIAMSAYPFSIKQDFLGKGLIKWFLLFAMIFSGGLIPTFLAVKSFGLLDSIWALILPMSVDIWSIIVIANFYRTLPVELTEAATIDGASHWNILFRIYIPLSLPALATILLFTSVWYWNEWFSGIVYMIKVTSYPLQSYLQATSINMMRTGDPKLMQFVSDRSLRAAQLVLAMLPILCIYPFLQRYFVKGLTLGAVKG
jgi:putative aldouronate transport system permease protein